MYEIDIVGLDHFLQRLKPKCSTLEGRKSEKEQKHHFYEWLRELVVQKEAELIAEEADFDSESLGFALAKNVGLPHINITMPCSEWKKHGITWGDLIAAETREAAFRVFELYMFEQVQAQEQEVILVMCGRRHFLSLQELLTDAGHEVHTYDVYDCEWFRGKPEEDGQGITGYYKP